MEKTIYSGGYRTLIAALRTARLKRGLDQVALGRMVGRSRQWVSKVEQVELRLDVVQLVTVCRALRLDASRLVRKLTEESPEEGDSFYLSAIIAAMANQSEKCFRQTGIYWPLTGHFFTAAGAF